MNNTFDINRFGRYAMAELHIEGRRLIRGLGISSGIIILVYSLVFHFLEGVITDSRDAFFAANSISLLIVFITTIFYTSASFYPFLKRGLATQNMMLPVANAEKFIYLIVKVISISIVLTLIFTIVAISYCKLYDINFGLILPDTISMDKYLGNLLISLPSYIFIVSICFLGAIFWRKSNLIKTFGIMAAVIVLLSVITGFSNKFMDIDLIAYILECNAVLLALSAGTIYLSWRRFKRLQITK